MPIIRTPIDRLKGIIPTDAPAPALYDHLAGILRSFAVSEESAVRTLAFLIGAILADADMSDKKRQRLIDLVGDDVTLIVAAGGDEE